MPGAGALAGASLAYRVASTPRLRVFAELGGFAPVLFGAPYACLHGGWDGCRNAAPRPQAYVLGSAGTSTHVAVTSRWYGIADAGVFVANWRYPSAGGRLALAAGLGIGRQSRSERTAVEMRWKGFEVAGSPGTTFQFGVMRRW